MYVLFQSTLPPEQAEEIKAAVVGMSVPAGRDNRTTQALQRKGLDLASYGIRSTYFRYALKNVADWKQAAPVLVKCDHRYELRVAYECANKTFPKYVCV